MGEGEVAGSPNSAVAQAASPAQNGPGRASEGVPSPETPTDGLWLGPLDGDRTDQGRGPVRGVTNVRRTIPTNGEMTRDASPQTRGLKPR
jgi:hypothetical protein